MVEIQTHEQQKCRWSWKEWMNEQFFYIWYRIFGGRMKNGETKVNERWLNSFWVLLEGEDLNLFEGRKREEWLSFVGLDQRWRTSDSGQYYVCANLKELSVVWDEWERRFVRRWDNGLLRWCWSWLLWRSVMIDQLVGAWESEDDGVVCDETNRCSEEKWVNECEVMDRIRWWATSILKFLSVVIAG